MIFITNRQWHRFPASLGPVTRSHPYETLLILSVSDLKRKASQVKSAGIKSYSSARKRISTHGTSTTPSNKAKPPSPPPHRALPLSDQSSSHVSRVYATPNGTTGIGDIDWANLSVEDKQAFFAWLDEFFARYLNGPPPPNAPPVPISTKSLANTTDPTPCLGCTSRHPLGYPAPPRPTPSFPSRMVSFRASQGKGPDGPDLQDEVPPSARAASPAGRRNLRPLSQQGPVCPHSYIGIRVC